MKVYDYATMFYGVGLLDAIGQAKEEAESHDFSETKEIHKTDLFYCCTHNDLDIYFDALNTERFYFAKH